MGSLDTRPDEKTSPRKQDGGVRIEGLLLSNMVPAACTNICVEWQSRKRRQCREKTVAHWLADDDQTNDGLGDARDQRDSFARPLDTIHSGVEYEPCGRHIPDVFRMV